MIALLCLIIGLLVGYYARTVHDYVRDTYKLIKYNVEANKAGVVRPQVAKTTRRQPQDTTSGSGVVKRPSPIELAVINEREREERLKNQ